MTVSERPGISAGAIRPVTAQAVATLGCGGLASLCASIGAVVNPPDDANSAGYLMQNAFMGMAGAAMLGTYVFLCMWQMAVNDNLAAQGQDPVSTRKIWTAWLIPGVALVMPVLIMLRLNSRYPVKGLWVALWWIGWIATIFNADTLEIREETITLSTSGTIVIVLGTLASFLGLFVIVRGISRGHVANIPVWSELTWVSPTAAVRWDERQADEGLGPISVAPHPNLASTEHPEGPSDLLRRRF